MQSREAATPAAKPVLRATGGRLLPLDATSGGVVQVPPPTPELNPHGRREGAGYSVDLGVGVCIAVSGVTSFRE